MIYTTVVDIYVDMNIKTCRTWSSKLDIEIEQIPKTCGFEFRIGARWILSVKPRTVRKLFVKTSRLTHVGLEEGAYVLFIEALPCVPLVES